MLVGRREFLVGATASMLLVPRANAQGGPDWKALAVEDTNAPLLPPSLKDFADQPSVTGPISDYIPFGTQPPTDEETELAQRVLDGVPRGRLPVEVALYFLDVASGKYGEDLRPFTTAWPVRWNPVIVAFFTSTNTLPSGDTSPWCAAFMNYCLVKSAEGRTLPAGSDEPTLSAAARSFRKWGSATDSPQPGDVVVFINSASPGHGHVGFFIAENDTAILVLGGNQFEGQPVRHAINRKWIKKKGQILQFHSYRADPQLHA